MGLVEQAVGDDVGDDAFALQLAFDTKQRRAQHFAAITLEAAVVVVQANAGEDADQPIENSRRPHLMPRVQPLLLPAADDVEFLIVHGGEKARDLLWVVLQVSIKGEDELAARVLKTG